MDAEPDSLSGISLSQGSGNVGSQERNLILGKGSNVVQIGRLRGFAKEQEEAGLFFGVDASQNISDRRFRQFDGMRGLEGAV